MWHKAPCSSRDYSGVRESGPRKIDEDGDDDGDVDEDDHRGDDSPPDGMSIGLRLIFLFCKTQKQGKNRNWHWALG